MRKFILVATAAATLMVTACAGRAPAPVQTVQVKDPAMDCNAITAELAADTARQSELGKEKGGKAAQNIVAATFGVLLFPPALFLMDFQGAADTELKALQSRDQYLSTLALQRCSAQPVVGNVVGKSITMAR